MRFQTIAIFAAVVVLMMSTLGARAEYTGPKIMVADPKKIDTKTICKEADRRASVLISQIDDYGKETAVVCDCPSPNQRGIMMCQKGIFQCICTSSDK